MPAYHQKSVMDFAYDLFMTSDKLSFSKEEAKELLEKAVVDHKESTRGIFTFGKYKGKTFASVHAFDEQYIPWLKSQPWYAKKPEIHSEIDELLKNAN